MNPELLSLAGAAGLVGVIHTLIGPDHYVPFVALAKARKWSLRRTLNVTVLCGIGHIASAVAIAVLVTKLAPHVFDSATLESARGAIAGWALLSFGVIYAIWGFRRAIRVGYGTQPESGGKLTWALFLIFVLGPCEPLVPFVTLPQTVSGPLATIVLTSAFSIATLATMISTVVLGYKGISVAKFKFNPAYGHAVAGLCILACGASMVFIGA
ncbi:hypothetical protein HUU59_09805 [bacterium]|nr:hypothetical protein [bacterium]